MKRFIYFTILSSTFSYTSLQAGKVKIEVFNVGQGNCVLVQAKHKGKYPLYMLVDIGTSSYKKEFTYKDLIFEEDTSFSQFSEGSFSSPTIPKSTKKPVKPKKQLDKTPYSEKAQKQKIKQNQQDEQNSFFKNLREKLKKEETIEEATKKSKKESIPPIYVQTIVITHPDKDHYSWITKLFSTQKDHIDHIIFGGLPEHYDMSGDLELENWINTRLKNNTNVYFPAIQLNPIQDLGEVAPSCTKRSFAPHKTSSESVELFKEALNFGEGIRASFLAINPTHFKDKNFEGKEVILRSSLDDNSDSLVLKIENGKSSAILTGDATVLTTQRIINNNVPDFLKTNALLASHHGSATEGSNNKEWIEVTQPEIVVISNGLLHGHPHKNAYENFKTSSRLKRVGEHQILVADSKTSGFMHSTQSAIFSTLTSGTITLDLLENGGIGIQTEESVKKGEKIKIYKGQESLKKEKDKTQEVIITESPKNILITPTPKKSHQKIENTLAFSQSLPLLKKGGSTNFSDSSPSSEEKLQKIRPTLYVDVTTPTKEYKEEPIINRSPRLENIKQRTQKRKREDENEQKNKKKKRKTK